MAMCIHSIMSFQFTSVLTGTRAFILSRDSHSRLYSQVQWYMCIHSTMRFTFTSVLTGICVFILSRDLHSRLYSQVHVHSFYHEIYIHVCIHSYKCIHSITRFTFTSIFTDTCHFFRLWFKKNRNLQPP